MRRAPWPLLPRLLLTGGNTAAFALLFLALSPRVGPAAGAFAALPVVTAAWLFGLPGGLLATLLSLPLNTVLLQATGHPGWDAVLRDGGAPGTAALLLIGVVVGLLRDLGIRLHQQMDALRRGDAALRESEARFAGAFAHAPIGMAVASSEGRWLQVNRALCELLGYPAPDLCTLTIDDLTHPEDRVGGRPARAPVGTDDRDARVRETRLIHQQGRVVWVQLHRSLVWGSAGQPRQTLVQVLDITARKDAQDHLDHAAHHDALTGLPNRRLFDARLDQAVDEARDQAALLAVLFLDLDGFKGVNDTWGHAMGDRVLQAVAQRLRAQVRDTDTVARLGGDEFLILLPHLTAEREARGVAEALRGAVSEIVVIEGQTMQLGASIGISLYPTAASDPATLVRRADEALYHVKAGGKNSYAVYTERCDTPTVA
jgi:diguanylate cyclase (GGDEF)-like protein/PAS domain S-box-containing protein